MDAATISAKAGASPPICQRSGEPIDDTGICGVCCADSCAPARPPSVIRGAECPPPSESRPSSGVYLTLDWLRVVGPVETLEDVRAYLRTRFGQSEPRENGLYFCKNGETFPGGVKLLWEHPSQILIVDASGSSLATMDAAERVKFARELRDMGLHGTRIDLAGDFVDQGLALYESALKSCQADELCGARVFNVVESRTADTVKGRTLYLGLRGGNGSGRYVRLYDKGLETGTGEVGEWERYEVEFTDQPARMALNLLVDAPDWAEQHKGLMLGAVEFRVATGDMHKARRPLAEWWAAMIRAVECIRHCASRPLAEFKRWKAWAQRCVIPSLESICRECKLGFDDLIYMLADPDKAPKDREIGSVIDQACRWYSEREAALLSRARMLNPRPQTT